ncbi:hypothetical protein [Hydromonas duriensis]|uniref:Uncharacterized protein n=1 Tax=Hydromonas duriensis TaxID=1527608 RepID=A0A4R6Y1I7_9BURK|nr:hypothetical protein [Hydromonas duriensis]TDR30244.1 hypothetical protein DFR44_12420 [Hydromonas duriensis]
MKYILAIFIACLALTAQAKTYGSYGYSTYKPTKSYYCAGCNTQDHYVRPSVRKNGEYVQGYMKTNTNRTRVDNFTQYGNINPYTGKRGTKRGY